jgi:hypothetical protein
MRMRGTSTSTMDGSEEVLVLSGFMPVLRDC